MVWNKRIFSPSGILGWENTLKGFPRLGSDVQYPFSLAYSLGGASNSTYSAASRQQLHRPTPPRAGQTVAMTTRVASDCLAQKSSVPLLAWKWIYIAYQWYGSRPCALRWWYNGNNALGTRVLRNKAAESETESQPKGNWRRSREGGSFRNCRHQKDWVASRKLQASTA